MKQSRPLESFRIFPYLAWGLIIGFAFFVYTLTTELKNAQSDMSVRIEALEARANQDPSAITDFRP